MSQLRHPHIVQFLGVCYLPGSPIPVLLMEKLLSSLDNLLETNPNIPLDIKLHLLTGTGGGVVYLHSHTPPIAHRDLTARNILVDSGLTAKIADLGVARIVNIQPGQLAATMTNAPGNNLYMPPETVQDEGDPRYNTAIDIFSFGVISLFTLTQTFPKDLKPATYKDPATRKLVARSEIERREVYIEQMKTALGESHSLVKVTVNCLEYDPNDRPTASEVLTQLEEAEAESLQCYSRNTKYMQLLERNDGIAKMENEIRDIQANYEVQLQQKDESLSELQVQLTKTTKALDQLACEKVQQLQQHQQQLSEKEAQLVLVGLENHKLQTELTTNIEISKQLQHENKQYCSEIVSLRKAIDKLHTDNEHRNGKQESGVVVVPTEQENRFDVVQKKKDTEIFPKLEQMQISNDESPVRESLDTPTSAKQIVNQQLLYEAKFDRLQAEKQEQACGYEELLSLQQQNMETQQKEIMHLSNQLMARERETRLKQQQAKQGTPPPYVVSKHDCCSSQVMVY